MSVWLKVIEYDFVNKIFKRLETAKKKKGVCQNEQ